MKTREAQRRRVSPVVQAMSASWEARCDRDALERCPVEWEDGGRTSAGGTSIRVRMKPGRGDVRLWDVAGSKDAGAGLPPAPGMPGIAISGAGTVAVRLRTVADEAGDA